VWGAYAASLLAQGLSPPKGGVDVVIAVAVYHAKQNAFLEGKRGSEFDIDVFFT
jgi:hypothetical protein